MKQTKDRKNQLKKYGIILLTFLLCTAIFFSSFKICKIFSDYKAADVVAMELEEYKPFIYPSISSETDQPQIETSNFKTLVAEYPDVVGWLTIDDTSIDYVFAQGISNDTYLRSTLDKKYLISGTLFLDYRSAQDFSNFNSIIYGHLMKNGTMFADVEKFQNQEYFNVHKTGTVYTVDTVYTLEIFAYLVVDSTNSTIYDTDITSGSFISYVQQNATQYRTVEIDDTSRVVTLSTCSNVSGNMRSVLVAKIIE